MLRIKRSVSAGYSQGMYKVPNFLKSVMIRIAHKEVHDAVFGGPARKREEDVKEAKESVENGNQSFG
ncbi:unnamed protein product [Brassica napus]|uniref:(rape) hypothetical protein n=1 Tax=Brassica napus TaxID=3708 RepID=A0A816PDL7_BRANA|nr:unnamed protein product [Brassica napus]